MSAGTGKILRSDRTHVHWLDLCTEKDMRKEQCLFEFRQENSDKRVCYEFKEFFSAKNPFQAYIVQRHIIHQK